MNININTLTINQITKENIEPENDLESKYRLISVREKGLKIKFINKKIAEVDHKNSTWFHGFTEDYMVKQGRVFYELSNKYYKFLILQFAIRKYPLYRKNVSFIKAIKLMNSQIYL